MNDGYAYRSQIDAGGAGREVVDWLGDRYRHSSREVWAERVEAGEVEIDGRRARAGEILEAGQWLVWHRPPWEEAEVPRHFDLLYEDPLILAVSKPSGLPTMPAGGFYRNTLLAVVQERFPEATPLHRLGRGTSGIVLFSRDRASNRTLSQAFREQTIRRIYLGLASGAPGWDRKTIDVPIGPVDHPLLGTLHAASPTGRTACSHVEVLERRAEGSLVQVEIDTGRPHQIRIHLASVGHPLVGDPLYGPGGLPRDDGLPGDLGYLLHAHRLSFIHPGGHRLDLEAPPPPARCPRDRPL